MLSSLFPVQPWPYRSPAARCASRFPLCRRPSGRRSCNGGRRPGVVAGACRPSGRRQGANLGRHWPHCSVVVPSIRHHLPGKWLVEVAPCRHGNIAQRQPTDSCTFRPLERLERLAHLLTCMHISSSLRVCRANCIFMKAARLAPSWPLPRVCGPTGGSCGCRPTALAAWSMWWHFAQVREHQESLSVCHSPGCLAQCCGCRKHQSAAQPQHSSSTLFAPQSQPPQMCPASC